MNAATSQVSQSVKVHEIAVAIHQLVVPLLTEHDAHEPAGGDTDGLSGAGAFDTALGGIDKTAGGSIKRRINQSGRSI